MTARDPLQVLRDYFGYDDFRPGQREVVENTLAGRDGFVAMSTGGGKSLCYQIPALCLPGTAIVISPLIALMKDQVDALVRRGVPAAALNSTMSQDEVIATLQTARSGGYKLLYVAPERFDSESFRRLLSQMDVSFTAVDEAHCISVWGHDFRLAYRRLPAALDEIDKGAGRRLPRIGLTATATPAVREDVVRQLQLVEPTEFILGYERTNLTLRVKNLRPQEDKTEALLDYLATRPTDEPTVIYSATIKVMPGIAQAVAGTGRRVVVYNGKLDPATRERNQDLFLRGEADVIVATNAFGMGVDKSDIREVIHFQMPSSLENYYQEVGRGGRDGKPARGLLLCQRSADERLQQFFIDGNHPNPESVRALYNTFRIQGKRTLEWERQRVVRGIPGATPFQDEALLRRLQHAGQIQYQARDNGDGWKIEIREPNAHLDLSELTAQRRTAEENLAAMVEFTQTKSCRTQFLLKHFGEKKTAAACGRCDRCLERSRAPARPDVSHNGVSAAAVSVVLKLISDAHRPLTVDELSKVLLGARDAKLERDGMSRLEGFGKLKHYNQGKLMGVYAHIERHGYATIAGNGALALTDSGRKAMVGGADKPMATLSGALSELAELGKARGVAVGVDASLLQALTTLRTRLARMTGVAPMMVASEAALKVIAQRRPASAKALAECGLNPAQQKRFGAQLLDCVTAHGKDRLEMNP